MAMDQPRVSALLRGKIDKFSTDIWARMPGCG